MTRKEWLFCLIAALCVALNYAAGDIYLPAMPVLKNFFNTTTTNIQATMSIFFVGLGISQMVFGPIADHIGYRRLSLPLCVLFTLSSVFCIYARHVEALYIGRLFQAIGLGGLAVIGRGSFFKYFEGLRASQLYLLVIPTVATLSPALAPAIGGYITQHFHWPSIFIVLAILGLLLLYGLRFIFRSNTHV